MITILPDMSSVFIWHVPPVPGAARQMAWWFQKQALACLQSNAQESCRLLCPWCPGVISHFCHPYRWPGKFAGQAFPPPSTFFKLSRFYWSSLIIWALITSVSYLHSVAACPSLRAPPPTQTSSSAFNKWNNKPHIWVIFCNLFVLI